MNLSTINSDYIFNTTIDYQKESLSHEYYALATIRYSFPEDGHCNLMKSERPDFVSIDKSFGLEVTTVDSEQNKKATKAFHKMKNHKPDSGSFEKIVTDSGARLIKANNLRFDFLDIPACSEESLLSTISERITTKQNKKYDIDGHLDLALLAYECVGDLTREEVKSFFRRYNNDCNFFCRIYFISRQSCIKYQISEKQLYEKKISNEDYKRLKILGRLTAEGDKSLGDKEWL